MALKLGKVGETISVICRSDEAVSHVTDHNWEMYQKTLDETVLGKLEIAPTRFVMRTSLSFEGHKKVANQQMGISEDGRAEPKLGYILDDVRCSLVDIINPIEIPEDSKIHFKKDSDGFASKELIARLSDADIVTELFSVRQIHKKDNCSKK